MMASGARFLREPFVHFVVAGALVFAAEALYGREAAGEREPSRVVFEASDVARLATLYRERVGREPSREELEGLVEDAVREEIYYREALALGLDEGDSIVRRRLARRRTRRRSVRTSRRTRSVIACRRSAASRTRSSRAMRGASGLRRMRVRSSGSSRA
jgi:hypothetical protein